MQNTPDRRTGDNKGLIAQRRFRCAQLIDNIVYLCPYLYDLHLNFHQMVGFIAKRFFGLLGQESNTNHTLNELLRQIRINRRIRSDGPSLPYL